MIELTRVDAWLYAVLSADAVLTAAVGGRIYSDVAPQDVAFPYALFSYQGGHDVRAVGPHRIMAHATYQVKAIDRNESYGGIDGIADRIDALLQGASGSILDGHVLSCVRDQVVRYSEVDGGVQYRHLGGLFSIIAQ